MSNDKILRKILGLLELGNNSGATQAEAQSALTLANKLMTEYNISEFDLKKVNRSSFVDKPFAMFRLDMVDMLQILAETFDCDSYYYKLKKEFHFFGFELDVKMCLHFAQMLSSVLLLELKQYKKTSRYKELFKIYQGKQIIKNFVYGFSKNIISKLEELQEQKKEIVLSSGTSLMVIKKQQVTDEFNRLYSDIKIVKNSEFHFIQSAYMSGDDRAENVQFNEPIETSVDSNLKQICAR